MFSYALSLITFVSSVYTTYKIIENRQYISQKAKSFKSLVNTYRNENYSYPQSVYKALSIVIRTNCLEFISNLTTIKDKQYSLVKLVHGGSIYMLPIHHRSGPKKMLEYAYFGEERNDLLFKMISGPHRDFNGHRDILFHLANRIRYKYINDEEIVLEKQGDFDWINHELIKKILSMNKLENLGH